MKRRKIYDDFYLEYIFESSIINRYWYNGTVDFELGEGGYYLIKQRKFEDTVYIPFILDTYSINLEVRLIDE